ncbi:MAG: hypothetical protein IJI47_05750 [Eubacterium sp.]|nr:hypothetical protein [Eubacterium sp.]MBR0413050.1 hypothetical protein [Eubacterium sp.]
MTKFEYKEPEFKVVNTSTEDVITTSDPKSITSGVFETGPASLANFGPYTGS